MIARISSRGAISQRMRKPSRLDVCFRAWGAGLASSIGPGGGSVREHTAHSRDLSSPGHR
jgi:hypothetical protein